MNKKQERAADLRITTGAKTYIGNGPNFMVKSIAESSGVTCPSFLGYVVKYTLPILIPLFALVSWLLLR